MDLAKAYVQIIPSAEGVSAGLTEVLGGEMERGGKHGGASFLKGAGGAIVKGVAVVGAAAAGAVAYMTKQAVAEYANFEQLVGGVETLFADTKTGADASAIVMQNAANAYATAGMSANEYMETVTSFAASLKGSLKGDVVTAAQVADMAARDMSDNANKMGTSMESIQNAYQGFAKQNYTMLDNLKLGYGGTQSEMKRLLKDAQKLTGVKYNINNLADVYSAIHAIQENLGITGTTAKEAMSTISGSLGMFKASWANLLVSLGDDNADIGAVIGQTVESGVSFLNNILPRVTQILSGLGQFIAAAVPAVSAQLPGIIAMLLPSLMEGVNGLVGGVADALPALITMLLNILPDLVDMGIQLVAALGQGIIDALPQIVDAATIIIYNLVTYMSNNMDTIVAAGIQIIEMLVTGLAENLPILITAAFNLLIALRGAIIRNLPELLVAAVNIVEKIVEGIGDTLYMMIESGKQVIDKLIDGFKSGSLVDIGKQAVEDIKQGIADAWGSLTSWASAKWQAFKNLFTIGGGSDDVGSAIDGSFARGLDYVPFDGFVAELHKGERVLTASENKAYSNGTGGGVTINITSTQLSQGDIDYIVETANRRLGAFG